MKECNYTLVGKRQYNHSYDELIKILKKSPQLAYDILYSKDYNRQTRVVDRLSELKESGKRKFKKEFSDRVDVINGCAEVNTSGYTTQSFIDSGLYTDQSGNQIMPVLQIDDYIERMQALYESKGLSKDEIKQHISVLKNSWKRIAEDGRDFHKIILKQGKDTSYSQTEDNTKGTSFEHLSDVIYDKAYNDIFSQVYLGNGRESRELGDDSSPVILKNINLSAKLIGRDDTITGHIDYIVVKPNGSVEVFNIKSSHESPAFWDQAKKEKYRNEFALLSRILQYNGINTNDIRFNIIPVTFKYDDQFQNINNIVVNRAECYSHNKGAFVMQESMKLAQRFIASNAETITINDSSVDTVNKQLSAVFPKRDIKADGITSTIEEYIDKNWSYWVQGEQPDTGWNLSIDGTVYHVKSSEVRSRNKEAVEIIRQNQDKLLGVDSGKLSARGIVNQIGEFRRFGFPKFGNDYLDRLFLPYFEKSVVNVNGKDKYNYLWQVVKNDTLDNCNIIMFKNSLTGQANFITLSGLNLDQVHSFDGRTNILGFHLNDLQGMDNQGRQLMKATYGNIETMRTMFLINEIIPQLGDDVKLGDLTIIGGLGGTIQSQQYPIQLVVSNFVKAQEVLNKKDPNLNIGNNFSTIEHISPVSLLINEFWDILHESPNLGNTDFESLKELISGSDVDGLQHLINGTAVDSLASAESTDVQIQRLEELIKKLNIILSQQQISLSPNTIINYATGQDKLADSERNELVTSCCKLLLNASITLDRLSGIIRISEKDLSETERLFARPQNISNSQVRIISKLLQDAIHSISNKLEPQVSDFNLACLEYYEAKGYSKARNAIIGDQSRVFKHLYQQIDDELFFKNPYDPASDLDADDRKFLKKALFEINKIRFKDNNFPYKSENDPALRSFIKSTPGYLWVPLEKASSSTRWSNPGKYFDDFKRRVQGYCKNPTLFFKEMYEDILSEEDEEKINSDIENMQAYNRFRIAEPTLSGQPRKGRQRLFEMYGKDYFETNLQNLVIDYSYKNLQEEEMNRMLTRAKGILLQLKLTGVRENDPDKFAKTIKHIDDYLKTAVFNRSIMEESSKRIIARLQPWRKAVSTAYIAASPIAAIRDTFGGFLSNVVRSMTKYRTDIDAKDVMWAYQFVLRQGVHSAMTIDLLDKLNSKYLISNINIEQQQEGYKTNRGGITNAGNWAYATLRKPDFLNRMVLFMGKLKHDNSHRAYSIVDGKLVYNWRMDGRFDLLASNDKSNMEAYNKQKALYLSQIMKFNEENPGANLPVSLDTNLPDGYTQSQIDEIKNLGDTIYGSYNRSTKAMYENLALGSQFGVFSTWMNGIYDVYLGKRRESSYETQQVQKEDENGNKLWIDDNGNITTEDTGVPYLTNIPLIVQGVWRTLHDTMSELYHGRGWEGIKENIINSPMQMRNLKRIGSDLLVALLLYWLFDEVVSPAYKEHKKKGDGKDILTNTAIELLYKGSSSSFEEFKGPLPILDYLMNNTSPASVKWGVKVYKDIGGFLFGDTTFGELVTKSQALPRSLQDTYKMYKRDTINGIGEE